MTDYKQLCAELIDELHAYKVGHPSHDTDLIDRARAALAAPSDQELLDIAALTIEPYQSCGIAIGEYEPETECAVEAYGSELIAFARAVLARWDNSNTSRSI